MWIKYTGLFLVLLLGLNLSLLLGSLLSDASVLLLVLSISQSSESTLLWNLNGSNTRLRSWLGDWEGSSNRNLLTLRLGLLVEDNQLRLVLVQSGDVGVESLFRTVLSSVVHSDTNGSSVSWGQRGSLELGQGETSASSDLSVVLDGWASNHWSQGIDRLWGNLSGLGSSCLSSGQLLAWLVKVHSDTLLPVLSEVVLQDW